eukprot:3029807-Rhodomonas_salina.1
MAEAALSGGGAVKRERPEVIMLDILCGVLACHVPGACETWDRGMRARHGPERPMEDECQSWARGMRVRHGPGRPIEGACQTWVRKTD